VHDFVTFEMASKSEKRKLRNREHIVDSFSRPDYQSIPKGQIARLSEKITVKSTNDLSVAQISPLSSARSDINDELYLQAIISKLLSFWVPEYTKDSNDYFRILQNDNGFIIDTNFDFNRLNGFYHQRVSPSHSSITPAYLVAWVLSTRMDIALALKYGSDLIISDLSSQLVQLRIQGLLEKRVENASKLTRFEDMVLQDTKALSQAINSGQLKFSDFMKLLEDSKKFKTWIKGIPPDHDLLDSYYKEITKSQLIDKLPSKVTRFSLFTLGGLGLDFLGLGGIGTASGVALNLADSFLVDKIFGGWKPSQFVEGNLIKALKPS
jgi:hypothetical protein